MQISKLILSGCKRLMLNNIQHIVFTPTSLYQLILGTNGSGKSTLLEELSPLPSVGKHYIKNGYKKIYIEHLGVQYVLSSVFKTSSGDHSFIRITNGVEEELNPGSTGQVQKVLVEQYFGITPMIHQMLIGKVKFTNLTPAKRREWITMLCSADYSYAVNVYQKLRSGSRDAQGALKHTKQRLYNETAKLERLQAADDLEERYQKLHQELSVLFSEQQRQSTPLSELHQRYQQLVQELEQSSKIIFQETPLLQEENRTYGFSSLDGVREALQDTQTEREVNRALREQLGNEFQELTDLIGELKANNVEDSDSLAKQLASLEQESVQKASQLEAYQTLKAEPDAACRALYEALGQLTLCLRNLPPNKERLYTKQRVEEANKQQDTLKRKIEYQTNQIANLERRQQHLLALKEEQCPNCNHRWVPGRSDQEVAKLKEQISQGDALVSNLKEELNDLQVFLEDADEYRVHFAALRRLSQEHPRLIDLWDNILNDTRLMDDPSSLIGSVGVFQGDVEIHVVLAENQKKKERLQTLLHNTTNTQGGSEGLEKRLKVVDENLQQVTKTLTELTAREQKLKDFYKEVKRYLESVEKIELLLEESQTLYSELMEGERQTIIQQTIIGHQDELSRLQLRRSEKATLEGIIKDLEKDQVTLDQDQKALALLASALSPTDGLIAEQLMGFIQNLVAHVNQFIASVWTYEMKVQGCGVESGDLDYKFPFTVNDGQGTLVVPDISDGSEAQLEIINLAFRLVMMLYLKLEEYPLYLDELGRSFDEQHRKNVMDFVKRLTDGGNYTQMFMVSHFAAEYGAFTQAEVLVLSDTNIAVPHRHNEHVEIA